MNTSIQGSTSTLTVIENKPRGLYFSKDFLRGLYSEGLMFGGKFAFIYRQGL